MNDRTVRPLLACTVDDLSVVRFPVVASAKVDGFRCAIDDGIALSRNGKIIPNRYIQMCIGQPCFNGLDGELVVGAPAGDGVFNRTSSGVRAADGMPDFTYWVFDNHKMPLAGYHQRLVSLHEFPKRPFIKILPQNLLHTLSELAEFERNVLAAGYEGVMIRRHDGPYKQGRSTLNEQILLRIKRFKDGEAIITGIEEGKTNNNALEANPLGYAARSTRQENMAPAGRVGTILATDTKTGQALRISPGKMTANEKIMFWSAPSTIVGRTIKYKYFEYGIVDAPRFATFQGFLL